MQSRVTARLLAEVAEIGRGSDSREHFRETVTPHLAKTLNFDCAAWTPIPSPDWNASAVFNWHLPIEAVRVAGFDERVARELGPAIRHAILRGAIVDAGMTARAKRTSILFNEVFLPIGMHSFVGLAFGKGREPTLLSLARSRGRSFDRTIARELNQLASVLALAEDLGETRRHESVDISLTPREREIVALVGRGLTNSEIANVLGISKNTVRNRLASAFEKNGSSNRAELVAQLRSK